MTITIDASPSAESVMRGRRGAGMPLDALVTLSFMAFSASLILEWVALSGLAGGFVKPFHVTALVFMALCAAQWRYLALPTIHRYVTIYGAYILLLGLALSTGLVHAHPYRGAAELMRQLFYAGTSVIVAGAFHRLAARPRARVLAWSGLVGVTVLIGGLALALYGSGVDAPKVLLEAIQKRDPDIVSFHLLRSAFRSQSDFADVGANLRHKVFGGLLLCVFVGLAYLPGVQARRRGARGALVGASIIGMAVVVLSLSRSVTLCLVGTLILFPLRAFVRFRSAPRNMAVLGVAAAMVVLVAVSPVGGLLSERFSSTGSYSGRIEASSQVDEFQAAILFGADKDNVSKSPHNLILDAWLAGGLLASICALVLFASLVRLWLKEAWRYLRGAPGWVLPVSQLWLLGVGIIPIVRAVTSGNQAHMIEWTAIGVFVGTVSANKRELAAQTAARRAARPDAAPSLRPVSLRSEASASKSQA